MSKTAIITGASRGIGAASARAFAAAGYRVAVNCRASADEAREVVRNITENGGEARLYIADVSDAAAAQAFIEQASAELGAPDVLVCNAGVELFQLAQLTSDVEWRRIIDTDLSAVFFCCRAALKLMIPRGRGAIVNIASVWGETGGSCESAYSAAKAGVIGFTKALAKEAGPAGITVNCVSPGFIDTAMNARLSDTERADVIEDIPLGRAGTPQEVADAVLFAARHGYITGAVIPVNGGMHI